MKIPNKIFIFIIKVYKIVVSPFLGNNCRYQPTCSSYAIQCFEKHNVFYAMYLGFKRLLKCNPLGGSGYDPVP